MASTSGGDLPAQPSASPSLTDPGKGGMTSSVEDIKPEPSASPGRTNSTQPPTDKKKEPLPEIDTEALLPTIIDRLAETHPDVEWAYVPVDPTSYASGYRSITYSQLANAVNNAAWWLRLHIGHQTPDTNWNPSQHASAWISRKNEPRLRLLKVGLLNRWDPRVNIVTLALSKINAAALFLSTALSIETLMKRIAAEECSTILVAASSEVMDENYRRTLTSLKKAPDLRVLVLPSLARLTDEASIGYREYNRTLQDRVNEPLAFSMKITKSNESILSRFQIHTHRWALAWLDWIAQKIRKSCGTMRRTRNFVMCRPHTDVFLILNLCLCIAAQSITVFPLPDADLSESTLREVLFFTSFEVLGAPGSVLAAVGHKKDLLALLKLKGVTTTAVVGQPLRTIAGEVLATNFRLFTLCGCDPHLMNLDTLEGWNGRQWCTLKKEDEAKTSFLLSRPGPDSGKVLYGKLALSVEGRSPYYANVALNAMKWGTQHHFTEELFRRKIGVYSPTPWLIDPEWTYDCESSDLVGSNCNRWGVNPLPFEQHMANHPLLKNAVIAGKARGKLMLLMQLRLPSEVHSSPSCYGDPNSSGISALEVTEELVDSKESLSSNFDGGRCKLSPHDARTVLERGNNEEMLDILYDEVDLCNETYPFRIPKDYMAILDAGFEIPIGEDGKFNRSEIAMMIKKAQDDCTLRKGARFRITEWFRMVTDCM